MISSIEVSVKPDFPDPRGEGVARGIKDLGIPKNISVRSHDVYWLEGDIPPQQLRRIASQLLADPVTQLYSIDPAPEPDSALRHSLTVTYNAGVTDPVEQTLVKALADMGAGAVTAVKTAVRYVLEGPLSPEELETAAARLLVNPIIQHTADQTPRSFPENPRYEYRIITVELLGAPPEELAQLGEDYCLSPQEMEAVLSHFRGLGRNPTDAEMETLAQTWSEHCVHKTFKGSFRYNGREIDNLLKSTVMKATKELARPWCLSVFEDNAGVIEFDDRWAVCFKVETHNHPSAIEPYGGAATGIGGVVRDVMGTGLSAKPVANTDVFAFGPPDLPYERLPEGVLHPRRTFSGVRAGVADYGNRLGIPTVNGAVIFDERYTANPLVFCGTVGLLPKELSQRGRHSPGDLVVLAGGRTGRDGIHGVTFASGELTRESTELSFTSVQIGNAIVEKKVIDALLLCRERGLFSRITDCGGGGLSSAIGEMAEETGVKVNLDRVPLKYAGLSYSEIWISESQERMLLAVPPAKVDELLAVFAAEGSEATVIGEFTDDKRLRLYYQEHLVADLEMGFLHRGRPQLQLAAAWEPPAASEPELPQQADYSETLLRILGSWNVCSKEWVVRQYDHEVQGGSVLKPLVGIKNDGPGDATIIRPVLDSSKGLIISCGVNCRYGDIDPYWMAASAIDEALRQVIATGGSLERVALLDNFCWGSASEPQSLGALVRASQACYDMSLSFGAPFVSGKDSLNNEYRHAGRRISIPHTLLISAMAVMQDSTGAVSMDFKRAGDSIYIVGLTQPELGGSEYYALHGELGSSVPRVDAVAARQVMERLSRATGAGLVGACHDLSEGGLGVALAEMAFAGGLGAEASLAEVPCSGPMRDDEVLFSESNSRFLVEVAPDNEAEFAKVMSGSVFARIGRVEDKGTVRITVMSGGAPVSLGLGELKEAWQRPLRW
jgi:phosphoribosylformylglycinamidine synthase II